MPQYQIRDNFIFTLDSVSDITTPDRETSSFPPQNPTSWRFQFHARAKILPVSATTTVLWAKATATSPTGQSSSWFMSREGSTEFFKTNGKLSLDSMSATLAGVSVKVEAEVQTREVHDDDITISLP